MWFLVSFSLLAAAIVSKSPEWAVASGIFAIAYEIELRRSDKK